MKLRLSLSGSSCSWAVNNVWEISSQHMAGVCRYGIEQALSALDTRLESLSASSGKIPHRFILPTILSRLSLAWSEVRPWHHAWEAYSRVAKEVMRATLCGF